MSFAAFVEVCQEDAWLIPQFVHEVERMDMPFAMHFDKCSDELKDRLRKHPLCVGSVHFDSPGVEYTEKHKQAVFDLLNYQHRWDWLVQWNIDEIWEKDAPAKLKQAAKKHKAADYLLVQWVNCWGDLDHIRVDTLFASAKRVKLYNVQGNRRWGFDHPITHGCKLIDDKTGPRAKTEIKGEHSEVVCLHTGLMTRELRELHKARWDRIYTAAVGNNPLGFWDYCLNETEYPPTVVENPYR